MRSHISKSAEAGDGLMGYRGPEYAAKSMSGEEQGVGGHLGTKAVR